MKKNMKSIMISAALLLGMSMMMVPQAMAGDKLTTLMNKYGKFLMKKTGCTAWPDKEKSEQWMAKVISFHYDPKGKAMTIESDYSRAPYKMFIPLSDIKLGKVGTIGDCYYAAYYSKEGIAIKAKSSEFDDVLFGSSGTELDMAIFYSKRDAQTSMDVLRRAIKMLDQ